MVVKIFWRNIKKIFTIFLFFFPKLELFSNCPVMHLFQDVTVDLYDAKLVCKIPHEAEELWNCMYCFQTHLFASSGFQPMFISRKTKKLCLAASFPNLLLRYCEESNQDLAY